MAGSIFILGHVSVDRVENVNGVRVQPGGAALYAAVAAKTLFENVHLVSVVGNDYEFMEVLNPFFRRYIKIYNMRSTRFHIKYDEKWRACYLKAEYGAGSRISASNIPLKAFGSDDLVHLSPMRIKKVDKIVNEIRRVSPETKISVNAWIDYIREGRRARRMLREISRKVDFFILNDSEAKALAETDSISTALRILKAETLVITLGELGAIISREGGVQMVPALNYPVGRIIDTTGAGDTWCGAFLAAFKLTGDLTTSVTAASIISSIKCSGWGFDNLINLTFREVQDLIEYVIGLREGVQQKRISDYIE